MTAAPPMLGFYEVVLEVSDLAAAERFYVDGLGLEVIDRWGAERPAFWVRLGREGFLGLWTREAGGEKGLFGGRGGEHVHLALRVRPGDLEKMKTHLAEVGIPLGRRDHLQPRQHRPLRPRPGRPPDRDHRGLHVMGRGEADNEG